MADEEVESVRLVPASGRKARAEAKATAKATAKAAKAASGKAGSAKATDAADPPPAEDPAASTVSEAKKTPKRVVIEDDGLDELPDLPKAAPIDPKVRKRRADVRKEAGRRRYRVLIISVVVVALVVGVLALLSSSVFSVHRVLWSGPHYTSKQELASIDDWLDGKPILTVDSEEVRRRVEALPWVRRAEVSVSFPRTVVIRVSEREAAADYRGQDGQWRIVDRAGRVIAIESGQPVDFLPVASAGPNTERGAEAGKSIAQLAELAETIRDLPALSNLVIGLSDENGDVTMTMRSPGGNAIVVVLGSPTQLRSKLAVLLTLLRDEQIDIEKLLRIDLTDPSNATYQ